MGKDNVLEYPKLDNEVITVKNFMVIKEATMKCGDITVLVGKQATGKSLLAKLRYFFWKYQEELFDIGSFVFKKVPNFKRIKEYNKDKIEEFCNLFPNIEALENDFFIHFESGDIVISLKKNKNDSNIKIEYSKYFTGIIKNAQKITDDTNNALEKETASKKKLKIEDSDLFRKIELLIVWVDFSSLPSVLYVPASRLFLATIQDNIFRLIEKGEYSLDPVFSQFASFWERYKQDFSNEFKNPEKKKSWFQQANIILDGDYVYENKIDYIKNNWGGMVKLRDASSGQQEALPLLATLNAFPNEDNINQLLIIEEPEAHLYPTSQKLLIKMIADVAREKKCKVMITTHSPYIPACVNNEIIRAQNKNKPLTVSAYNLSERTVHDLYHEKQDLIDVDKLDEVSDEIVDEYFDLTEKQDSAKKGKGKIGG